MGGYFNEWVFRPLILSPRRMTFPVSFRRALAKGQLVALSASVTLGSLTAGLPVFTPVASAATSNSAATGGTLISFTTAGGAWTTLTGPIIAENNDSEIGDGTIILNAPAGFEFDTTGSAPTVRVDCTSSCGGGGDNANNINGLADNATIAVTRSASALTITITDDTDNSNENMLTWQNVRVRPTAAYPLATGNITKSGTSVINGVTAGSTNLGTLTEVGGVCNGLGGTIYIDGAIIRGGPMDGLTYNGTLIGTGGNDVIIGGNGAVYIDGLGGNDTICGGNGADILNGGPGNDDIFGGNGADSITGGSGDDDLNGDSSNDVIFAGDGNDDCEGGSGSDEIDGCGFDDTGDEVGQITVIKDTNPDNAQDFGFTGSWSFTLDDDADATLQNSWTIASNDSATRTITESVVGGWSLTNLVCTGAGGDSSVSIPSRTATLNVDSGEEIVCTFTNGVAVTDTDGDGVEDSADNCQLAPNADQLNTDGLADGGDACDTDDDEDGELDVDDNCALIQNAGQEDLDNDGQGDACDPDDDGDTVNDDADNCPVNGNADQTNTDGLADGGDACDTDDDEDGDEDGADNCPLVSNADQADFDGDSEGDACDTDDDGDNIIDTGDNCLLLSNPDQLDSDEDAAGNACDTNFDYACTLQDTQVHLAITNAAATTAGLYSVNDVSGVATPVQSYTAPGSSKFNAAVAAGSDEKIYTLMIRSGQTRDLAVLQPDGSVTVTPLSLPISVLIPTLGMGPDGNLYALDGGLLANGTLYRISTAGTVTSPVSHRSRW